MNNPYEPDQRYALYPNPPGSAGYRLCYTILGLDERTYLSSFNRRNTMAGEWSIKIARAGALSLYEEVSAGHTVVLLGRQVWAAWHSLMYLHRPKPKLHPFEVFEVPKLKYVLLPHPSGLCREWDDSVNIRRAREVIIRASPELAGIIPQ